MRPRSIIAAVLIACVSSFAGANPRCPVYRLAIGPKIDGDVRNDPAWRTVPGLTGFYALGGGYTVSKQSTARIGWTDRALFIAVDCEEPDIGLIDDKRGDGGQLWLDNGVEIFIQLPGSSDAFQFIVNTAGARTVGEGSDKVTLRDWTAAATKGEAFWSVEIEIPFACLGVAPSPGSAWRGAFCRNIWEYKSGGDKFTAWPALLNRFLEPEHFAFLEFRARSLSAGEAAKIAQRLNLPYRQHLLRQIEELARAGREYQEPLALAAHEKAFAAEARALDDAWARLAALAARPASASLPEVRKFIAMAKDLKRRSYELKYRSLIERLLAD